ncbi:hypothetical protein Dsin_008802 [Dipteronia sinensis]|uniref:Reverse transcriptase domain-containing protein n=1 Tax=Dipteronia sinensis TaxID=43782 RepID=A0AAE0APQ8_9ROSI|nr:hypothetical protein Dsin_008802 [Dipteronia sinensis]
MCHLAGLSRLPWLCLGDFNKIIKDSEKFGGVNKCWKEMSDFRETLEECNLEDMGYVGSKFTWSNKREGSETIMERLDRALCNRSWRAEFPQFVVRVLEFWGSDHRPLIIDFTSAVSNRNYSMINRGMRFFFEDCWVDDKDCQAIVEAAWKSQELPCLVGNVLNKIEECGRRLKSWNLKKRGELRQNLKVKRDALKAACSRNGLLDWRIVHGLESQLNEVMEKEERYWKKRAKVEWLRSGDRNTNFFHSKASARKVGNRIQGLMDGDGVWKDSRIDIERIAGQYFTGIFCSSNPSPLDLSNILDEVVPKLSQANSRFLDLKFSREEIRKAIFDMNPTKAPGSDGLPAVFFQKYWESIGPNVVDAWLSVLNNRRSVDGMNKTIIALIPKIQNPVAISDFRPISLCNVIYKVIAKAMTNRLKHVLGDVISATQCAFIPGRLISDNTIVGFECLHRLKRRKRKRGSMAIKLDMSKAYDRVK